MSDASVFLICVTVCICCTLILDYLREKNGGG